MVRNVADPDRIIRGIAAILLGYLYFAGVVSGWLGIVALVVGIVLLFTAIFGFCPIYRIFGFSTCKLKK
ncbi:MAG: DUF2892 domain-containing protein [Anaerolineae bacterium]|nr:DUF2892 domain-containing protein [Anaerolineae bacterium]